MTDYEKLLEEADVTVRVLSASVPMVNADEAETIRRLAAALRDVMADVEAMRARLRATEIERDELSDRLDAEKREHEITRGYRQRAEKEIAEAKAAMQRALDARATPNAKETGKDERR